MPESGCSSASCETLPSGNEPRRNANGSWRPREAVVKLSTASAEILASTTQQAAGTQQQAAAVTQTVATVDEVAQTPSRR